MILLTDQTRKGCQKCKCKNLEDLTRYEADSWTEYYCLVQGQFTVLIGKDGMENCPIPKITGWIKEYNDDTGALCPNCNSQIKIASKDKEYQSLYCGNCSWEVRWIWDDKDKGYFKTRGKEAL